MSEDREIEITPGESQNIKLDINIPLAVSDKDRDEVVPKKNSIRDEDNQDNSQNLKDNSGEDQEENLDQSNLEPNQKLNLSDIGRMNQRPEMRNNGQNQEEDLPEGSLNENGMDTGVKDKSSKPDSELGPIGKINQRKLKKPFINDKINQGIENEGEKNIPSLGRISGNFLPNSRTSENDKKIARSEIVDDDYPRKFDNKNDFLSSWNKIRKSVRDKNNNSNIDSQGGVKGVIVNRGSKLLGFEFYRLCWMNLISSWGLTYFGLLFLFIVKYVAHSPKIAKFTRLDKSARLEIIENKEKTDYLMIIAFLLLTLLFVILLIIVFFIILLFLKAIKLTLWGLITNPEQFLEDWNTIYKFIKTFITSS